jgi:hypothetical protein
MKILEDYALVVGINQYAGFKLLKGARHDAEAFAALLKKRLPTAHVPPANIDPYCRHGNAGAPEPDRRAVLDLVKALLAKSPNRDERIGRRLWIFFAGHGATADLDEVCFLTTEATDESPEHVPGRRIANIFRGCALFQEVVLCMDCCRDYDKDLEIVGHGIKTRYDASAARGVKYLFIYGTGFGSKTRELEIDGVICGAFTWALIDGLSGKATDAHGRITSISLKRHVERELDKLRERGIDQKAHFEPLVDFVFFEGLAPHTVTITVHLTVPDEPFVVLDHTGINIVANGSQIEIAGESRRKVRLDSGRLYVLAVPQPGGGYGKCQPVRVEEEDLHVTL